VREVLEINPFLSSMVGNNISDNKSYFSWEISTLEKHGYSGAAGYS
jgi:hypothetical protein